MATQFELRTMAAVQTAAASLERIELLLELATLDAIRQQARQEGVDAPNFALDRIEKVYQRLWG